MRVLTNYSDRSGKVKLMALGHLLVGGAYAPRLGNHAVIIQSITRSWF
jgi:D-aspartate ligase